jgi:hypothetical protein
MTTIVNEGNSTSRPLCAICLEPMMTTTSTARSSTLLKWLQNIHYRWKQRFRPMQQRPQDISYLDDRDKNRNLRREMETTKEDWSALACKHLCCLDCLHRWIAHTVMTAKSAMMSMAADHHVADANTSLIARATAMSRSLSSFSSSSNHYDHPSFEHSLLLCPTQGCQEHIQRKHLVRLMPRLTREERSFIEQATRKSANHHQSHCALTGPGHPMKSVSVRCPMCHARNEYNDGMMMTKKMTKKTMKKTKVHRDPKVDCSHCHQPICIRCERPWHFHISCAHYQQMEEENHRKHQAHDGLSILRPHDTGIDANANYSGTTTPEDVAFYRRAKEEWKFQRCPHCGIFTERYGGCVIMTCRLCRKKWRWLSHPL